MNAYLFSAGILSILMAIIHSLMGEKYFLPRLYKPVLPFHLGTEIFINRTLRTAWHFVSLSWVGGGLALIYLAQSPHTQLFSGFCWIVGGWYLASALLSLFLSHGRHFSWVVLLVIALLTFLGM